ncbi:MAG TPA: energy-coupling factor transporter transmembrane component T [Cellulomonas sp.]
MTASALVLFQASGSVVERLDPRAKATATVALLLALITTDSLLLKAAIVAVTLVGWFAARLSGRVLAGTTATLAFFFLTTLVLRGIVRARTATDAVALGPILVSRSGAIDGVRMCVQILGVVLLLTLLVRSTEPTHLAEGVELMLRPLARIGVPAHEATMMFIIALRFLPIISREAQSMQRAQLSRGGGLVRSGVLTRARGVLPILIPLFLAALVRARDLAEAMDSRGYRGAEGRTTTRDFVLGTADRALIVLAVAVLALAVATRLA